MPNPGVGLLLFALALFFCLMALMPPVVDAGSALAQRWTALEKTTVVQVSDNLVARLRQAGIRELNPVPVWSGARGVFVMHVNGGEPAHRVYSDVSYASWMYKIVLTEAGADVFVREDGKEKLTPTEYRRFIEQDASHFLERLAAREKEAAQLRTWD